MRYLEEILVFSSGPKSPRYYPQMSALDSPRKARMCTSSRANLHAGGMTRGGEVYEIRESPPSEIIEFPVVNRTGILHPTQKPLDLMRYLVRTYSRSGETVLDFSMGSGTTGHAAILEKRRFIGIEIEQEYYDVAFQRLDLARHGCESENAHSLEEAGDNPLFD